MADNSVLSKEPGILFDNTQTKNINRMVHDKIDNSLFLFFHYTPDILIPPNSDGKYFMGVSNLYKLIKDSGWVLEQSGWICGKSTKCYSTKLNDIMNTIHTLREIQNHNTRSDNKMIIQMAEFWWKSAGCTNDRPQSQEDYNKVLTKLEQHGCDLMAEVRNFVEEVINLSQDKKNSAIKKWKDEIIKRYVKERSLFKYALNIYLKYSSKHEKNNFIDIITSWFTNDYFSLKNYNSGGYVLYNKATIYRKAVDDFAKQKLDKYKLNVNDMNELCEDIKNNPNKYIDYFYDFILHDLIVEAENEIKTLDLDSLCDHILNKTKTIELKINEDSPPYKIEGVKLFNI